MTVPNLTLPVACRRTAVIGSRDADPVHAAIRGDNLAAVNSPVMSDLAGSVDLVYADPPYNTGNRTVSRYHDSYLDGWVEFMRPRIDAAHRLLSRTGVIMVAIGDDEHHRLRLLLDDVFGADNFISNVVWHGSHRPDSRWVSNGADYMLIYAKSRSALKRERPRWREPRDGVAEILAAAEGAWRDALDTTLSPGDPADRAQEATRLLKEWQRGLPKSHPSMATGLRDYNKVDERGDVYRYGPLEKPQPGPYDYQVVHPVTGRPVPTPKNGWRMPQERMAGALACGDVVFGPDHRTPLRRKLRLRDLTGATPSSVFSSNKSRGAAHLRDMLGDAAAAFPFPKDHEVLMRWIGMTVPDDGVVVDLFAGSGSTLEAVLRLNEEGSRRRCVAVTSNEVSEAQSEALRRRGVDPGGADWEAHGVFEQVLVPRLRALLDAVRPDGTRYDKAVSGVVETWEVADVDPIDEHHWA